VRPATEEALGGVRVLGAATSPEEAAEKLRGCRSAVIVVSTGGTEHIVLRGASSVQGPVVLAAHPYANSLPALLEAYPLARSLNTTAVVMDELSPEAARAALGPALSALRAAARLRGARLGLVGEPSPWLVYSRVEPGLLRERLGVELVEISIDELEEVYRAEKAPRELLEKIAGQAVSVERSREELEKALRLYMALRRLAEKYRLDAVTVECFEIIPRLDTTACLPFAILNSEGLVAGCEGDVPATIAMMIASWSTGQPAFMANPARFYPDGLLLAHCTAPLALGRYRLLSHFETGRGVGVSVEMPRGSQATLVRLSPKLDRLRVATGEVVDSGLRSSLHCRTQVRLRTTWDPRRLLYESLGNHHILVPGVHVETLGHAARLLGLELEQLG
jgi:L-fucose isomerase-like protein